MHPKTLGYILCALSALILVGIGVTYFVFKDFYSPANSLQRTRAQNRQALAGRDLEIGDVVGVTFLGSPAVVTFAAFGDGPTAVNNLLNSQASTLASYAELPTVDGARAFGKPPTTWITDAGINWMNNENTCISLTTGLDGRVRWCNTDDDCQHRFPCDTSQNASSQTTLADGSVIFQNYDCPEGIPCVYDSASNTNYCSLSVQPSFTCDTAFGGDSGYAGVCRVYAIPGVSPASFTCPPPPACNVFGQSLSDGSGKTTCGALYGSGAVAPNDPCTGCNPGQVCANYDPVSGEGTCSGIAETYIMLRSHFRAEGTVLTISDDNQAYINWERLQMAYPYYYGGNAEVSATTKFMPWLAQEDYVVGSERHMGCRLLREWCNAEMQERLFGTVSMSNLGASADPTGWLLLSPYVVAGACGGGAPVQGTTSDCFTQNAVMAQTAWPLQIRVDAGAKNIGTDDISLPADEQFYTVEILGSAQDAKAATVTSAGNSPYDIPVATTYRGILAETGIDPETYVSGLVGNWVQSYLDRINNEGPWQMSSDPSSIFQIPTNF